jgi:hypothetical protein
VSEFGDFDPDDAFGTEGADPEQVAMLLHRLEGGRWDDLTVMQQVARIEIIGELLALLRRQGSNF